MYLVRETGTYYKEYVVDGRLEKVTSLVGSSSCQELPDGFVLSGKLEYKITEITEPIKDFAIRQCVLNLSSEQLEPIISEKKPKIKPKVQKKAKPQELSANELAELLN